MGTWTPMTVVGDQVAGAQLQKSEARATRKQLESLIKTLNHSTFDIGELLHSIKKNNYYHGFNTFTEYLETLAIKLRKAQYLRRIAEVMEVLDIDRATYEQVGVAKLREITSLDPEGKWLNTETVEIMPLSGFIRGFIEKHAELSLEEIKAHVKLLKGLVGEDALHTYRFQCPEIVADRTINPALELARRQIGSVSKNDEGVSQDAKDGACWEVIAIGFLLDPANEVLAGDR